MLKLIMKWLSIWAFAGLVSLGSKGGFPETGNAIDTSISIKQANIAINFFFIIYLHFLY